MRHERLMRQQLRPGSCGYAERSKEFRGRHRKGLSGKFSAMVDPIRISNREGERMEFGRAQGKCQSEREGAVDHNGLHALSVVNFPA